MLKRAAVIFALQVCTASILLLSPPQLCTCTAETLSLQECIHRAVIDGSQRAEAGFDFLSGSLPEVRERSGVALKVKEYYYGVLLAREMKGLLTEVRGDLTRAREKAQKLLDYNSPTVEESDVAKLEAFAGDVLKDLAEAEMWESVGLHHLKSVMQMSPEAKVELAETKLVQVDEPLADVDSYLTRADQLRPEFRAVEEGLEGWTAGGDVEDMASRIRRLHQEGVHAVSGIEATRNTFADLKTRALTAMANFDFGVGPGSDVSDALQQYAKSRAAYLNSIYNYNVAVANLKYVVGEEPLENR